MSGFGGVFGFGAGFLLEDDSDADDSDACDPDDKDESDMIYIYIEDFMFGGYERMRKNGTYTEIVSNYRTLYQWTISPFRIYILPATNGVHV